MEATDTDAPTLPPEGSSETGKSPPGQREAPRKGIKETTKTVPGRPTAHGDLAEKLQAKRDPRAEGVSDRRGHTAGWPSSPRVSTCGSDQARWTESSQEVACLIGDGRLAVPHPNGLLMGTAPWEKLTFGQDTPSGAGLISTDRFLPLHCSLQTSFGLELCFVFRAPPHPLPIYPGASCSLHRRGATTSDLVPWAPAEPLRSHVSGNGCTSAAAPRHVVCHLPGHRLSSGPLTWWHVHTPTISRVPNSDIGGSGVATCMRKGFAVEAWSYSGLSQTLAWLVPHCQHLGAALALWVVVCLQQLCWRGLRLRSPLGNPRVGCLPLRPLAECACAQHTVLAWTRDSDNRLRRGASSAGIGKAA